MRLARLASVWQADRPGKYTNNSRVQQIQAEMTERCLELLALPPSADDPDRAEPSFLLDIGCGSGLSGEIIEEEGHVWAGCDISASMLCASCCVEFVLACGMR